MLKGSFNLENCETEAECDPSEGRAFPCEKAQCSSNASEEDVVRGLLFLVPFPLLLPPPLLLLFVLLLLCRNSRAREVAPNQPGAMCAVIATLMPRNC